MCRRSAAPRLERIRIRGLTPTAAQMSPSGLENMNANRYKYHARLTVLPTVARAQSIHAANVDTFTEGWCFAGLVRANGKRLTYSAFEVSVPKDELSCCGTLVRRGKTDQHGHFLIEPLSAGRYYAKFKSHGIEEAVGFAVREGYARCDAST